MKECENCGTTHDGEYGSGRFCSSKCARGFSTKAKRNEINEKVSKTIKNKLLNGEQIGHCKLNLDKPTRKCKCGNTIRSNNKSGYCKSCLYGSVEYKSAISLANKGNTGGYRKGAGRTQGGYYKTFYFDSPFEIEIAKQLDTLNINWIRNTTRFYYIYNDKRRYYIPDFYISDYNLYIETKGYWYGDKKQRTYEAVSQNNLNWKLIMFSDWKYCNDIMSYIQ